MNKPQFVLFWMVFSISWSCLAIDIGPLTFTLEADRGFVTKKVKNNTSQNMIYQLDVYEVDKPNRTEKRINPQSRELLFTPKQFMLAAGEEKLVKFYYTGNQSKERYYRAVFKELPSLSAEDKRANFYLSVELNGILVVTPKNSIMNYDIDYKNKTFVNTGNKFFELIIKENCDVPDSDGQSIYLTPGQKWTNESINKKNVFIIIYDRKFHFIQGGC